MEIQKYISELLSEHDCVIIPGLGGFVGSYMPAQIHPVYHTFQPPSKKILFNINLKQNDGLLANHISHRENISFNEAGEKIRQFAEETIMAIRTKEYLVLQNIGKLYMGEEGTIQFDQDMRANHLPESYGLQPFFSAPVNRDPYLEKAEKRYHTHPETSMLVMRALTTPLRWAAILAVPVAVAIIFSFAGYDSYKSGSWNTADIISSISPFTPTDKNEVAGDPVPAFKGEEETEEAIPVEDPVVAESETLQPSPPTGPRPGDYAVIVGAFSIESNAERLVRNLVEKGMKARIYDQSSGGLSRVAAGVFEKRPEAIRFMNAIKSNGFPEAWLLKK